MPSGSIRIGIDARTLGAARITGVERYVRSLITHLAAIAELPECLLYVDSPEIATTPPIALGTSMRMRLVSPGRAWLRLRLPLALRADRVAVMHFPATVLPRLLPCPSVVTVHDLAFEFHPECYDPADLRMQLQGARRSIKRATSVLAVSQSTADDVIRLYRRDRENITVTREGVDERFLAPGPTDPPPGWPDSYVLYVGSLAPRKNLASLLEAYAEARAQGIPETLVLAGAGPPDYVAALRSEAVALGIIEDVIFSGYLADDLLPAAYANARAFVYLSLYEGFGLPILEAMACGTPVIASASSCFPEIVGDAGVLVEPRDVQAQARALVELLTDESKRQELAAKSRERARQFSWRDAAAQTLDVYLRASGER